MMGIDPSPADIGGYRTAYKSLFWLVRLLSLAIAALAFLLVYFVFFVTPKDNYFAELYTGSRAELMALDTPNINSETLLTWAATATTEIMTFGFNDIDRSFEKSRLYFSPEGWESFKKAMVESGVVENVINYQQIITSIPESKPVLLSEGIIDNKYGWIVGTKIVMTIRAGSKKATQLMDVKMVIVRMPTSENPMGLGIQTFVSS